MYQLATTKVPKRSEAFELSKRLLGGQDLTDCEKSLLVNYFAPALPAKAKTTEDWVSKATADKKDPREYLRYMHAKGGELYASNGHILFWGETKFPDGVYAPRTKGLLTGEHRPPSWARVIPDVQEVDYRVYTLAEQKMQQLDNGCQVIWLGDTAFDLKYVKMAANGNETIEVAIECGSGNHFGKLRGRHALGEYVIMAMRV